MRKSEQTQIDDIINNNGMADLLNYLCVASDEIVADLIEQMGDREAADNWDNLNSLICNAAAEAEEYDL